MVMKRRVAKKRTRVARKPVFKKKQPVPARCREISVMAWIEDPFGQVLLVKQRRGRGLWSLPGGKVQGAEKLVDALRREVREETGLMVEVATPLDLYDRPEREAIAILYRVILKRQEVPSISNEEIETLGFRGKPPRNATPSLRYFWKRAQKTFEPLSVFQTK
jgi:ADP-ribose pyrophosphatase YjhB (NUDIX family)